MNLRDMHAYLGELLQSGVDPALPVTSLIDGQPSEIEDFVLASGRYMRDPSPQMIPGSPAIGAFIVAIPMGEYEDHLREPPMSGVAPWKVVDLPVECLALPAAIAPEL